MKRPSLDHLELNLQALSQLSEQMNQGQHESRVMRMLQLHLENMLHKVLRLRHLRGKVMQMLHKDYQQVDREQMMAMVRMQL